MNDPCKRVHLLDRDPDNNLDRYLDCDPDNFAPCQRGRGQPQWSERLLCRW